MIHRSKLPQIISYLFATVKGIPLFNDFSILDQIVIKVNAAINESFQIESQLLLCPFVLHFLKKCFKSFIWAVMAILKLRRVIGMQKSNNIILFSQHSQFLSRNNNCITFQERQIITIVMLKQVRGAEVLRLLIAFLIKVLLHISVSLNRKCKL